MPITPETDKFGGIEDWGKGPTIRWTWSNAGTEDSYLQPVDMFKNKTAKMRATGQDISPEMVRAETEIANQL